MTEPLTDRQEEILEYIQRYISAQGYPPTIREIGTAFGIRSTNGVNDHLKALERKGYVARGELKSRALTVLEGGRSNASVAPSSASTARASAVRSAQPAAPRFPLQSVNDDVVEVPIVGKVAAGAPILAHENVTDHVRIDSFLLGSEARRVFGLKVTGDSMIGDGILDGDYIFVRKQIHAQPGDIVVALIEEEATVKRYYPEGDRIRFQPSNPRLKPIYVHRDDFRETQIIGVVVGVYRRMN